MTLTAGILKQGTFPVASGVIYVAAHETFVSSFVVYSTYVGSNELIVWTKKANDSSAYRYRKFTLVENGSVQLIDAKAIVLGKGDAILGQTVNASATQTVFTMFGVERT